SKGRARRVVESRSGYGYPAHSRRRPPSPRGESCHNAGTVGPAGACLRARRPHGRRVRRGARDGGSPGGSELSRTGTTRGAIGHVRYLILSDIHANREALTAVLSFVRRKHWDKAVFLGDLVGYGANPNQTVDMVRKLRPLVAIRGNHDKVCSGIEDGELFNRMAPEAAPWTRRKLTRSNLPCLPK